MVLANKQYSQKQLGGIISLTNSVGMDLEKLLLQSNFSPERISVLLSGTDPFNTDELVLLAEKLNISLLELWPD